MRCLKKASAKEGLELSDAPVPTPNEGEVLVRVTHAGICGTDVHIYNWDRWSQRRIKPPVITGHEFVGVVEEWGSEVDGLQKGQRVSAEGHIACGHCRYCRTGNAHICEKVRIIGIDRDGCFAEYLVVPQENIWPVDERIRNEHAAVFDPLGNAMHTVMSESVAGKTVLITGAGAIGLFAIPIARHMGAEKIIVSEPNESRRAIAEKLSPDLCIDTTKEDMLEVIHREVDPTGVDVLLEMSGHPKGFADGLRACRGGGTAVLLGIPAEPLAIDWAEDVIFKALKIVGVNGRRMFDTWYQSSRFLVQHGKEIDPILTHEFDFKDYEKGFDLLRKGQAGKVLLKV